MRPGLVGVGIVLVVLGAGAFLASTMVPAPRPVSGDGTSITPASIRPNQTISAAISGPNGSDTSVRLHWASSISLRVSLYPSGNCIPTPSACGSEVPLVTWVGARGANWSFNGSVSFPLLLVWSDAGNQSGTFSANAYASAEGSEPAMTISTVFTDAAAVCLALIGAVAVFLGLFLRGGVYRRPRANRPEAPPPPAH